MNDLKCERSPNVLVKSTIILAMNAGKNELLVIPMLLANLQVHQLI